jgi:hypothetical protein
MKGTQQNNEQSEWIEMARALESGDGGEGCREDKMADKCTHII